MRMVGEGGGKKSGGLRVGRLPKLHVGRSSSEALRPPQLIYWAPSRVQVATFVSEELFCGGLAPAVTGLQSRPFCSYR